MMTEKIKLATLWLDGCSGCHMSFLDIDDALVELAEKVELVYSPLVDAKIFPEMVDVTLIEGAVSSDDDLEKVRHVRQHTKFLIALGDCAVTGNIPAMRNRFAVRQVLEHVYQEKATRNNLFPSEGIPMLLDTVRPLHAVVPIDLTIPGCPPHPHIIRYVLTELLANRIPDLTNRAHFG
jgi:NAD-reducing hydrogenase small subunit